MDTVIVIVLLNDAYLPWRRTKWLRSRRREICHTIFGLVIKESEVLALETDGEESGVLPPHLYDPSPYSSARHHARYSSSHPPSRPLWPPLEPRP